jgi:hypothetical protein
LHLRGESLLLQEFQWVDLVNYFLMRTQTVLHLPLEPDQPHPEFELRLGIFLDLKKVARMHLEKWLSCFVSWQLVVVSRVESLQELTGFPEVFVLMVRLLKPVKVELLKPGKQTELILR